MNSKNILYLIGGIAVLAIVGTVFFFSPKTVLLPITGELAESLVKPQDPIVPEGVVGVGVGEGAAATPEAPPKNAFWSMKLVNETVTDADLDAMESAGIGIIEGEWGMADATPQKVLALLDRANARGMKLIMNFTENSAWGYAYGEMGAHQAPQWQKAEVQAYVRAIMKHPALFGYDVSNEAGENLPVHREPVDSTFYEPNVIVAPKHEALRPDGPEKYGVKRDDLSCETRCGRNVVLTWAETKKTAHPLMKDGYRFIFHTPKYCLLYTSPSPRD